MAEYLSPGVYVKEESSGVKPIAGAGTSTGAFVGLAEKGPLDTATFVSSFTQFTTVFGGFKSDMALAFAVYQFFQEGGGRCFVTRIAHSDAVAATATIDTVAFTASSVGAWGNDLLISVAAASNGVSGDFKVTVSTTDEDLEVFDNINETTMVAAINDSSRYIQVSAGAALNVVADVALLLGADGSAALSAADFISTDADAKGLHSFDSIDDINIVAMPDAAMNVSDDILGDVILGGLAYCELRKDCFFVADAPKGKTPTQVNAYKTAKLLNSSYGAMYYPWVKMAHPAGGSDVMMPPSGAIAGIYANTDNLVGVHKAPAGVTTARMKSVKGIERNTSRGEHDLLNPAGINVIRFFPDQGIVVWGARTLSSDSEWKYINVRRLFLFVEESLDEGVQFTVFEPNSPKLWGSVKRNMNAFLQGVWRNGALLGSTEDEAYYVKVDEENNPAEERNAGRLNIEVGIAPVNPAEFVVIRISQKVAAS